MQTYKRPGGMREAIRRPWLARVHGMLDALSSPGSPVLDLGLIRSCPPPRRRFPSGPHIPSDLTFEIIFFEAQPSLLPVLLISDDFFMFAHFTKTMKTAKRLR